MATATALILPSNFREGKLSVVKPIEIPIEEQVVNSIKRDLERLNWKFKLPTKKMLILLWFPQIAMIKTLSKVYVIQKG